MIDCPKCGDGSACGRAVSQPDCPIHKSIGDRVRWRHDVIDFTGTVKEGGTGFVLVRSDDGVAGWIEAHQLEVIR